ncbi:MAG: hypothetical protein KDD73_16210 [Anaerolineales bacterium]|nr:hypothetical protein [Anaerolineales bacterium]MCB9127557.1 hypothetical protein [Ardenticatenales bacterium]
MAYATAVRATEVPTITARSALEERVIVRTAALERGERAAYGVRGEAVIQVALDIVQPWPADISELQVTRDIRP